MSQQHDQDDERRHYRYHVGLRLWRPKMDPQEITAALGVTPKGAWRAGDLRRTPVGKPVSLAQSVASGEN